MTIVFASAQSSMVKDSENNAYYIRKGLMDNGLNICPITPVKSTTSERLRLGPLKVALKARGLDYHLSVHPDVLQRQGMEIARRTQRDGAKLVIANAPYVVSRLPQRSALVIYMDAPSAAFLRMGHYFDKWDQTSKRRLIEWDMAAIDRADLVVYHSQWAVSEAMEHYSFPEQKFSFVRPGANLPFIDRSRSTREVSTEGVLTLLFFGRDWVRKGGVKAFRIVESLRASGVDARLIVSGPLKQPAEIQGVPWVEYVGRLSKDSPSGLAQIDNVFREADFLLAPTEADSSTAALREAAGYGVPSISTLVGAHAELLRNGEEGLLLEKEAEALEYARQIAELWTDRARYLDMRGKVRLAYENRMTWFGSMSQLKSKLQQLGLI